MIGLSTCWIFKNFVVNKIIRKIDLATYGNFVFILRRFVQKKKNEVNVTSEAYF